MEHLILASTSPRRAAILSQVAIPFRVVPSAFEERVSTSNKTIDQAKELTIYNARGKAHSVAAKEKGLILGVDTVVFFEDAIWGKPKDAQDAMDMLSAFNGKSHQVLSGFCLLYTDGVTTNEMTGCDIAVVHMKNNVKEVLERYVASGEPLDKAGAYGIQEKGAILISSIEGDFYTVVGLPLAKVLEKAAVLGYPLV